MCKSSKFGYYPIKINKSNEKYTKGLVSLGQEYLKNQDITVFANSDIVKKVQEDFDSINRDIQNEYLRPSINNRFDPDNLYDAIEKLGIFGLEVKQLYELGQYVKSVKFNNDIYIGHNIIYPNYESKWCFTEFKKESPKFIAAFFTDEEYSQPFIKITAKELFVRYNKIKSSTTLEIPANFSYILKNINNDLKKHIEGVICYMPMKNDKKIIPSKIRNKNKKE